ncbi:hypothetical protein NGM10_06180 [Halorussus salilacus]|uniref:hypothetical protein n=1 Tax=Halorussus salilacus TaxID=2953750 RepID=UPI0020A1037A|nr:hypothetical protein [Halorussus salilacus]USZ69322.1 hypothetical protein NGM10_06180 [Halorussus salilacus]
MSLAETLGLDDRRQKRVVGVLQVVLAGITLYGVYRVNVGLAINAAIPLGVTFLPAYLERDTRISMDPGLVLWMTAAVFLHAVGALGVYQWMGWYDQVAHALSASVVAGVGYATVRAFDRHSEAVSFPSEFVFAFLFVFVMAFGVLWEIMEFATGLASQVVGGEAVLAQYGIDDIIYDLAFNQVGALVVAVWGHAHLSGVSRDLSREMDDSGKTDDSGEADDSEQARDTRDTEE